MFQGSNDQLPSPFLKTLRYESIFTSLNVTETSDSYLLWGTDLSQKIEARVVGTLLSRGCVVRRPSALCQSGACAYYLEPDAGYEGY